MNNSPATTATMMTQQAVALYLGEQRQVPSKARNDINSGYGENNTISLPQFAVRSIVLGPETSTDDTVQFSFSTQDPLHIEQQYSKFKIWISESPDSFKPELAQLLYPTFTHLYLELVCCGHKPFAQKFHKRHQSTFLGNAEFATFIRQLAPILTPKDIAADANVSAFHNSKYSVTLSNKTFHFLMRYLQGCGQPILLHIFRGKVDLKLADALGASSKTESLKRMEHEATLLSAKKLQSEVQQEQLGKDSKSVQSINELIREVRETAPCPLPTSCLFKLTHPYSNFNCSFVSSDTSILLAGAEDSSVRVWHLMSEHQDPQQVLLKSENSSSSSSQINQATKIQLGCDLIHGRNLPESENKSTSKLATDAMDMRGHRGSVYGVALVCPQQSSFADVNSAATNILRPRFAVSVSEDTSMRIWDLEDGGKCRAVYTGHTYPVWCVAVDSLGMGIVTGSMDKTVKLWDMEYTHPIRMYVGHEMDVDCVAFHPNCNYLATGSVDKSIRLWSHADARMVRVFNGSRGAVSALAFSPDGKFLASCGEDRRVLIWDLATSSIFKDLKGHSGPVNCLAWSHDSATLSSGDIDGTVRVWDVKETNFTGSVVTVKSETNSGKTNLAAESPETLAVWRSGTENVLDLRYSNRNTLNVTGISSQLKVKEER